jgi:hypothetical protein
MTQLDLFKARKIYAPASHVARRMIAILAVRARWTTRAESAEHGLSDRECRAGRKASHGRIIYGQRGYILLRDATAKEIGECLATTASMINELREEYRVTNRRAHGVLNGGEAK